jgi:hypothetical protein
MSRVGLRRLLALAGLSLFVLSGCAGQQPELPPPPPDTLAALEALSPNVCNPTVASVLASRGLSGNDVQSMQYAERIAGSGNGKVVSLDAYIGLADGRSGVVRLGSDCGLMTAFPR